MRVLKTAIPGILMVMYLMGCTTVPPSGDVEMGKTTAYKPVYKIQGDKITFEFDPVRFGFDSVHAVAIRGTFTSWKSGAWMLERGPGGLFTLTKLITEMDVPGNSGQPEFKFSVDDDQWVGAEGEPDGWHFKDNFVVLFSGDDPKDIAQRSDMSQRIAEEYASEAELSNFRGLSGGSLGNGKLFRSYHPFIESRGNLDSEEPRIQAVQKLMVQNKIAAVLNLSDTPSDFALPSTPAYYKNLFTNNKVLFNTTSYEISYFAPEGRDYSLVLQKAFSFIAGTPGPYLVHCRLGTDRTGVLSAVLEAFMGVDWKTISDDFQKSNTLGIREYRHSRLLAYAFKRMIGKWPYESANLKTEIRDYLLRQGVNQKDLDAAEKNLGS